MRRFTASGTAIKKNRWFRFASHRPDLPDIDHLLDLYWGGPERRITGLTVRIIAVNAIALLILMVGILYLGRYQNNLIEAKLETFAAEVELVSAALSEGAIEQHEAPSMLPHQSREIVTSLSPELTRRMTKRLSETMGKRIRVFGKDGTMLADSHKLVGPDGEVHIIELEPADDTLYSIQVLKSMAGFIIKLLPDRRILPAYPVIQNETAQEYPDASVALNGEISISAWYTKNDNIFLSAAAPLYTDDKIHGAVLLTREGHDIEEAISEVWLDVLRVFAGTLAVTVLLSIYLSGLIARPLRKLANAAEAVRTGQSKGTVIPDLSYRHDEIGDLSIVLRDMTEALWERMDSIESFAADVSHELKNPLTSLRSALETASVVKKEKDRDKLFGIIMHDLERLDRLISDISHASRLDTELSREAFKAVNIKDILRQLIDAYKNPLEREQGLEDLEDKGQFSAKAEGKEIRLEIPEDGNICVWALEGKLLQVFENLISNALSFSPEGGVVKILVVPGKRRVRVRVEDEGPGIPENKLESVFERFYSERPEHEDYGRHSGLGLSICRQIISAHNGHIFAENIEDENGNIKGARFTVTLNMI